MSKFKKYSFWVALMSAVVLLIENLSAIFGFEFNKSIFESVFLSVCGILVVLGIIVNDKNNVKIQGENQQEKDFSDDVLNDESSQDDKELNNKDDSQNDNNDV